jgi:hypothetical protein
MTSIELRARVGPDGVLALTIPVGISEANREVKVVVEPAGEAGESFRKPSREEWAHFVAATAGAWLGELERPDQGKFEVRDQWP